jgi:Flp pilus assembly protein TadD
VWNEKGNVHVRAGDYEEAVAAFDRAIELDRSFGWPYCNLGLTYLLLGKYAEAILLLQKSLELLASNKDRAVAWNGLGNLYRCLNDYDNAVVAYQKADELDPENSGVRDTVEFFHSEPNTRNAQVWNELADQFFKSGSYAEASSCYQKAIEMEPLLGVSYSNLALSLTYEGKFNKAIPLYLKSIELFREEKDKAISWNRLGNVYRRLNDYDNAIAAYQNAVKLNSGQMTLATRARFSLLSNCYVD